ncbi:MULTISPECIES: hypothetical protein [unclassified Wolbachia]|uniref:hypothetical protein n=1 Tax=unclassified Wolbachia TaxID=2640676 RepID=UPI002231CB2A|nr:MULTISPECIES: hypothetical protein [unclassified Wolbachia]
MPSFFDNPVKKQLELAIYKDDHKLVQILLGSEFCQLWQYWLAHAMISYNMLAIERDTQCNLPLKIIERQREVLEGSLELLRSRKQELDEGGQVVPLREEERRLTDIQDLISKLFRDARQIAEDHKRIIEQENVPGTNFLYCTQNEAIMSESNSTGAVGGNEVGIPEYTAHSLRNVSAVTQLHFVEGCNVLVDEMEKMIVSKVWEQTNFSTRAGYYLNEINNYISGENGQVLDEAVNYIPNNRYSDLLRGCLAVFRPLVNGMQVVNNYMNNNLQNISCVDSKIKEVSEINSKLSSVAAEKSGLKKKLLEARQEVKEKAVDRMTDGKLFDKEFVHTMYEKLLDYYLMKARGDEKNVLHSDIENNGVDEVKRKILNQTKEVSVDTTHDLLKYALDKKREASVKVVSVLLLNLAHAGDLCKSHIEICQNEEVRNLSKKSNNTIMIDVHDSLFDFDDKLVNLVSVFPTKEGNFDKRGSEDKIMLEQIGGKKYKDIVKELKRLKDELEEKRKIWENKENRNEWWIFKPFFMVYDLIYQGLSEGQYTVIDSQAVELHRRALYADRFADEGIMYDHVKKTREGDVTSDKEVKKYIERLYGIANQGWGEAKGQYTFGSFLEDTGRMVKELRQRRDAQKDEIIREEKQGRKETEEKLEQLGEVLKQEVQVRQSAEQKAKQLEQELEQKNSEKIAIRACCRKLAKLDEELQDAVSKESEDKIVEAAVGCTRGSPEEVIDAIIEEIKVNREKIIKEGRVSDEIIEASVRSFSNQSTLLSDVDVSQSMGAGVGR